MTLHHSPLDAAHRALGAKLVPFGGWDMPLNYQAGTLAEHLACRHAAVAFDVSHLGTVRVQGPGSLDALQAVLTNDLTKVAPGRHNVTAFLSAIFVNAQASDAVALKPLATGAMDALKKLP